MSAIGTLRPERLRCGDPALDPDHKHLPATYHPGLDVTACLCAGRWWDGPTPTTWHSVERTTPADHTHVARAVGTGAPGLPEQTHTTGWDTYELPTGTIPRPTPAKPAAANVSPDDGTSGGGEDG